jgi:CheY-like chemotaxis protein
MQATVLVVDDHASIRTLLEELLTGEGYAVVTAVDGCDALAVAARLHPDVVLSDLEMPQMGGEALIGALAQRHPAPPVILMSADPRVTAVAREAQAAAAFVKPFDIDALLARIAACAGAISDAA